MTLQNEIVKLLSLLHACANVQLCNAHRMRPLPSHPLGTKYFDNEFDALNATNLTPLILRRLTNLDK